LQPHNRRDEDLGRKLVCRLGKASKRDTLKDSVRAKSESAEVIECDCA
jgi:hypothetical protein